ncbi:MAG TPA: hypothetical protein VMT17_11870 [Anaeromyxobacteraceae bacterium]|nr:hypothetical protein [Anaeromyxobacteraceae bacterium]
MPEPVDRVHARWRSRVRTTRIAGALVAVCTFASAVPTVALDDGLASSASLQAEPPPPSSSMDFDLLGEPKPAQPVDTQSMRLRRTLLDWHQGLGLGMFALQLATTVVGQLNYDDKFGGANTNKYAQTHAVLAYSTFALFIAAGTLALVAPAAPERRDGFDRISLHKIGMFTATAGMAAQVALGIWTTSREGYLNQQSIATAHLVVGYVTLLAVATGVGALVF